MNLNQNLNPSLPFKGSGVLTGKSQPKKRLIKSYSVKNIKES